MVSRLRNHYRGGAVSIPTGPAAFDPWDFPNRLTSGRVHELHRFAGAHDVVLAVVVPTNRGWVCAPLSAFVPRPRFLEPLPADAACERVKAMKALADQNGH